MGKPIQGAQSASTLNYMADLKKYIHLAKSEDPLLRRVGKATVALVRQFQKLDISELDGKLQEREVPSAYDWKSVVIRYKKLKQQLDLLFSRRKDPLYRFAKKKLAEATSKLAGDVIPKVEATSLIWHEFDRLGVWLEVRKNALVLRCKGKTSSLVRANIRAASARPRTSLNIIEVTKAITGVSVDETNPVFRFTVSTSDGKKHTVSIVLMKMGDNTVEISEGSD